MRHILFVLVVSAFIAVFHHTAHASETPDLVLVDSLPSYVRIVVDDSAIAPMSDSLFYSISGKIIFKVNSTRLNLSDPLLHELAQTVLPYANSQSLMLVGIDLRGAASPEGPYNNNVRLSRGRAAALRNFLYERLDSVQLDELRTQTMAEDYVYLVLAMEQAGDPETPVVRRIVEECGYHNMAEIKKRLRAYGGGRLWYRLLETYYPGLRAARIVLYFRPIYPERRVYDPIPEIHIPMPVVTLPASDGWHLPHFSFPTPKGPTRRRHVLAVSSNLLYDAFYMPNYGWAPMPNVSIEYFPPRGNFTFRVGFMSPYYHRWSKNKFFQIRDYHIEVRRYFNPGPLHTGWYAAAYVNNAKYGVGFDARRGWQGEGVGAALKGGYVLPLGHGRWRLDLHLAAGGFVTKYDPYVYGNPITGAVDGDYYYDWTQGVETFNRRNHRLVWMGPTEIGVTLSFDLLYKRLYNTGVSFNEFEPIR